MWLPPPLPPQPPLPVRFRDLALFTAVFLGGFLGAVFAATRLLPAGTMSGLAAVVALLAGQALFMLFAAWLVVLRPHRLSLADIGLRPAGPRWSRLAVAGGLLCVPLVGAVNYVIQSVLGEPLENPQLQALAPEGFSWISLIAMLVLVGMVVPFAEEVVFRGLLFGWLRKHLRFTYAALWSALLFSVLHGVALLIPALFIMGLVLATVRERSGSLWPCILLHGVFNSLMTISYYTVLAAGGGF